MAFHSTKRTISRSKWCNSCKKFTQHDVCQGRIGRCLECPEREAIEKGIVSGERSYVRVPITPPCLCGKYDFPHYHAGSKAITDWDNAMRQYESDL